MGYCKATVEVTKSFVVFKFFWYKNCVESAEKKGNLHFGQTRLMGPMYTQVHTILYHKVITLHDCSMWMLVVALTYGLKKCALCVATVGNT